MLYPAEKHRRELESMQYIVNTLLKPISEAIANDFMDLWTEYETGRTPEAIFVKDGKPLHYSLKAAARINS